MWPKYILFELQKYRGVIFHDTEEIDLWFEKNWLVVWKKNWEIWQILPEHMKVSKLGLWWDSFVQSREGMTLKFAEELFVMARKNNAKFEEELTCHFKTDVRKLTNFDLSTRKSKTLLFYWLLWPKYIMFELRKVQRSYVWWHWRLMQNLKECAFKNDIRNLANMHRLK